MAFCFSNVKTKNKATWQLMQVSLATFLCARKPSLLPGVAAERAVEIAIASGLYRAAGKERPESVPRNVTCLLICAASALPAEAKGLFFFYLEERDTTILCKE